MEQVPNTFPDLFWGYTAIWMIVSIYVLWLGCRVGRAEKKLKDLNSINTNS